MRVCTRMCVYVRVWVFSLRVWVVFIICNFPSAAVFLYIFDYRDVFNTQCAPRAVRIYRLCPRWLGIWSLLQDRKEGRVYSGSFPITLVSNFLNLRTCFIPSHISFLFFPLKKKKQKNECSSHVPNLGYSLPSACNITQ